MLHVTKSSAYIAHFTGDGHFLIRSLLNIKKGVGHRTPLCGTPCLRNILFLFVLSTITLTGRQCMYHLLHRNILPVCFFGFRSRPPFQTLSNVFCRSMRVCFCAGICLQSLVLYM